MEILGHSQITTTMEIYTDVLTGPQVEAMERVSELLMGRN